MRVYSERLRTRVIKLRNENVKHLADYQNPHYRVSCEPMPDDEMVKMLCGFHYHTERAAYNAQRIIWSRVDSECVVDVRMEGVTGKHCPIQEEIDPVQREILETALHEVVNGLNEDNVCYSCDKLRDLYNIAYLHGQASVMMNLN